MAHHVSHIAGMEQCPSFIAVQAAPCHKFFNR